MHERAASRGSRSLNVAVTQWGATGDLDANLTIATQLVHEASLQKAHLVALPENCLTLGSNSEMRAAALSVDGPEIGSLSAAAKAARITIVLGGFKRKDSSGTIHNTALVIGSDGKILGGYDKIHLFDAKVSGQTFAASSVECRGDTPAILLINDVKVGLTICYDVRFPELYRQLALAGAEIILVPAAFTFVTGQAHWEVLLRARAIENGVYIVAPATISTGAPGFETYGHAMVIDPWGAVLTDLGETQKDCRTVELDLGRVGQARESLPVLLGVQSAAYANRPKIITAHAS